jgi:hypothetical protein
MRKKAQAPMQLEDDSKYLTVVHPYPLNANLRLEADKRALAFWLACCTGKDVLRALYHKPTVRSFVRSFVRQRLCFDFSTNGLGLMRPF